MEFQIKTAQGKTLNLSSVIPQEHRDVLLPNAYARYATDGLNSLLFQKIIGNGFEVLLNHYSITKHSTFTWTSDRMLLQLHVALKNNFLAGLPGLARAIIKEKQFNMIYLPIVNTAVEFSPGNYQCFHINYSLDYLEKYAFMLPALAPFIDSIKRGMASQLFPSHSFAPPEMLSVINQMLDAKYNEPLQKIYYDIKVSELLFLALREAGSKEGGNGIAINAHDEIKMHEAKTWLENNVDRPLTLAEIARLIGTNEFKLKKGFKQLFGTTVFDYLLKLRMERAKQLLQETTKPIHEIAFLTGYASHAGFTNAFNKHFGYSPMYVRKR
jgi:AraC-like DNA-binding protein